MASGGDDRRVLLWNVAKSIDADVAEPTPMQGEHDSNIFCINFDLNTKVVFSGGNDERVLLHDLSTAKFLNQYLHDEPVFGISCHPSMFFFSRNCLPKNEKVAPRLFITFVVVING